MLQVANFPIFVEFLLSLPPRTPRWAPASSSGRKDHLLDFRRIKDVSFSRRDSDDEEFQP